MNIEVDSPPVGEALRNTPKYLRQRITADVKGKAALKECLKQIQEILWDNALVDPDCEDIDIDRLIDEDYPHIQDLCLYTLRMVNDADGHDKALRSIEEMNPPKDSAGCRWLSMLAAVVEAFEKENYPISAEDET